MAKRTLFVIDGQEIYGAVEAARIKGCSVSAIYKARQRDKIDNIGKRGARSFRVRSAGRLYETASECAKANNVSVSTVYKATGTSRENYIGSKNNPNFKIETQEFFNSKSESTDE